MVFILMDISIAILSYFKFFPARVSLLPPGFRAAVAVGKC